MKALELAKKCEQMTRHPRGHNAQCAYELRRLAEVNAELLEALSRSADLLDERCAGLGAYARSIVAKAKEQQ